MFQKFINELLEQTHELKGAPYMLTSLSTTSCVFTSTKSASSFFMLIHLLATARQHVLYQYSLSTYFCLTLSPPKLSSGNYFVHVYREAYLRNRSPPPPRTHTYNLLGHFDSNPVRFCGRWYWLQRLSFTFSPWPRWRYGMHLAVLVVWSKRVVLLILSTVLLLLPWNLCPTYSIRT